MSQGEDLEILEIGDVLSDNLGYNSIECMASAEWNRGSGRIEYGAHVSGEGNIMLEYRQN